MHLEHAEADDATGLVLDPLGKVAVAQKLHCKIVKGRPPGPVAGFIRTASAVLLALSVGILQGIQFVVLLNGFITATFIALTLFS